MVLFRDLTKMENWFVGTQILCGDRLQKLSFRFLQWFIGTIYLEMDKLLNLSLERYCKKNTFVKSFYRMFDLWWS